MGDQFPLCRSVLELNRLSLYTQTLLGICGANRCLCGNLLTIVLVLFTGHHCRTRDGGNHALELAEIRCDCVAFGILVYDMVQHRQISQLSAYNEFNLRTVDTTTTGVLTPVQLDI